MYNMTQLGQAMTVEVFASDLISYVEKSVINSPYTDWKDEFRKRILDFVDIYLNNQPKVFMLGEDYEVPQTTDVGVQVDIDDPTLDSFEDDNFQVVDNSSVLRNLHSGVLKHRELEHKFRPTKSVELRRKYIEGSIDQSLQYLPFRHYDFSLVNGACCENIIGYVPIPTGVAGPLTINNETFYIPMSTTEGALIASTNRGCKAINECGGVYSVVFKDGMSRAPALSFDSLKEANACLKWLSKVESFELIKSVFEATSSYARLTKISPTLDGRLLFIRFVATTGDAMGMNMVTKGVSEAVNVILKQFPSATLETISGNMCVDKKASSVNWILGRGKSVCAEATISSIIVNSVLKTDVDKLVRLGSAKLQNGALNSISIGGANAHAANVVAAIFLATGQDAAQVVSSSMCSTRLMRTESGDLNITCTMNCLEVGTVGGGTTLSPQQTCLKMLGCCGPSKKPGDNAVRLATIICGAVLAGELSLLASQCTGDLVRSHLRLNRSSRDLVTSGSKSFLPIPENFVCNEDPKLDDQKSINRKISGILSPRFLQRTVVSTIAPADSKSTNSMKIMKKLRAKCDESFT